MGGTELDGRCYGQLMVPEAEWAIDWANYHPGGGIRDLLSIVHGVEEEGETTILCGPAPDSR